MGVSKVNPYDEPCPGENVLARTLDDLDVNGKRVLVRGDLNVPMRGGEVSDATRIERLAPTIIELADKGAAVVVMSHFGRPKGVRDETMSLRPLVGPLGAALGGRNVAFADDCIGPAAESVVRGLKPGEIALLENLRFHPGEEANDPEFARALAALGDFYVNDAFSAAHRAHASTEAIARLLYSAAGRLMQTELEALATALEAPERPVAAIVGGAKVSTKLDLLGNLLAKVDVLAIGGAMANTFLHALGTDVGASLCETEMADTARSILAHADEAGCEIALPSDAVIAREFKAHALNETVPIAAVPGVAGFYIGPSDLSNSLGVARNAPEVEEAIETIVNACQVHDIACGITASAADMQRRTEQGFRMLGAGRAGGGLPASAEAALRAGRATREVR